MIKADEDFVWELANSVRWLSQTFKQRFKIEKFLFGELYAAYHTGPATEIIQSLMEELGYDKEETDDDDDDHDHDTSNTSNTVESALKVATSPNLITGNLL